MEYDTTAPVLALVIDPGSEVANLRPMNLNVKGAIATTLEGPIAAVDLDGGSVMWHDDSGKRRKLALNLLATKIARLLNAGLLSGDTINGRALIAGEATGPLGDLVSADITSSTLSALKKVGVEIQPG